MYSTSRSNHEKWDGISIVTFTKPQFSQCSLAMAVLYMIPHATVSHFLTTLSIIIENKKIDMVMVDINIDGFDDDLNQRLVDFQLIINESTHLDEGLLVHAYLSLYLSLYLSNTNHLIYSKHLFLRP